MLNISPINFQRINNNFKKSQIPMNKGLTQDVFVRSTSFKGKEVEQTNSFKQWAEETDFIKNKLAEILFSDDHIIGEGYTNIAFEIPDNPNYVLRIPKFRLHEVDMSSPEKIKIEDVDSNLDINIGQCIAKIIVPNKYGYSTPEVEVLIKQQGESIGVQPPETLVADEWGRLKDGVEPYEAMSRKEKYARTIHNVAQLPVKAYEKLITDFTKAHEAGYEFDHLNSNNLLVDSENKSINLIDMGKKSDKGTTPNYANLLYSLTNCAYYNTYTDDFSNPVSSEEANAALQDSIEIIDKFMQAMQNTGSKFVEKRNSYEFAMKFIPSLPNRYYCRSFNDDAFWKKAESMGLL